MQSQPLGDENRVDPEGIPGTREHAEFWTKGRHAGVRDALQWLTFSHLPTALQNYSRPFYMTAVELIGSIDDSPELTTALNKLIEAKDSAVRAGIKTDTGRAGSVPRPTQVVNPPLFDRPAPRAYPKTLPIDSEILRNPHPEDLPSAYPKSVPPSISLTLPIKDNPQA